MAAFQVIPSVVYSAAPSDCVTESQRPQNLAVQACRRPPSSSESVSRLPLRLTASCIVVGSLAGTSVRRRERRRARCAAVAQAQAPPVEGGEVHSPFEGEEGSSSSTGSTTPADSADADDGAEKGGAKAEKPKLPLTLPNVETVLDDLRPYLKADGGDAKIIGIEGTVVRVQFEGACSSCSASSVTLKMGIERTLMERIPEITEVVSVMPEQEPLTEEGLEEVLNGIRPFLKVSGGAISLKELQKESKEGPRVELLMEGPPVKSMAVRLEIVNRIKRRFPAVQDIHIGGNESANDADEKANRGI
eukprot:TRINITY_DN16843_c0_g1_i2.p1 TRINITY_DN16843_c0_g1~~TRINITY_DN16843_c0_g1_i2.p1  ORF type:complete len:304 (-),score=81.39 TRINITY_DN16843_c0_g1_i2:190-1101(-)